MNYKMKKERLNLFIFLTLISLSLFAFMIPYVYGVGTYTDTITITESEDYDYVKISMLEDDTLDISITMKEGKIDLFIFDSENFDDLESGSYPTYEEKALNIDSTHEHYFEAPYSDDWYIVFDNILTSDAKLEYIIVHKSPQIDAITYTLISGGILFGIIMVVNFIDISVAKKKIKQ
ncbi:MAG: hypothetical protein ACTSQP_19340 [Promethearchaeota archaeon]